MEQSLSSVFEKHLGFPGDGGARIGVEDFVSTILERSSGFEQASNDIVRWVDHFFETEEAFGERKVEFAAYAEGRESPVLQLKLGDQEFVVLESEDEEDVVVVSNAGTMAVSRTAELVSRLKAAELPAQQQYRPTDAFKPAGERVYRVNSAGVVSSLDAKAVMAALRSAPMRAEPQAKVANASRLAAFSPSTEPKPYQKASNTSEQTPRSHAAREVQSLAQKDQAGAGATVVKIIERSGGVRDANETSARVWQHLASQGSELTGRGASAVSIGQHTYAVKAGGVTALVQRPAQALASGGALATKLAERTEARSASAMPSWLRELLTGASRSGFWIDPSQPSVAASVESPRDTSPGWVSQVMEQARDVRQRAQDELAGDLDPAPRRTERAPLEQATVGTSHSTAWAPIDPASPLASVPGAAAASRIRQASDESASEGFSPRYRVSERGPAEYKGPIGWAGALPATTLQALFTSLEHSAAREGRQLRFADVELSPTPELGRTQSERSVLAMPVARLDIDSVPLDVPQLRGSQTTVASTGADSVTVTHSPAAPQRVRPQGRIFSLPFEEGASLRIGPELDRAMARAFARPDASEPLTVPATLDTLVRVSGGPGRVRIEIPELRGARPRSRGSAAHAMGMNTDALEMATPEFSTGPAGPPMSGFREIGRAQRAYGAMPPAAAGLGVGTQAFDDIEQGMPFAGEDSSDPRAEMFDDWSPEMDLASPRGEYGTSVMGAGGPSMGSGATAMGAMLPASGMYSRGLGAGLSNSGGALYTEPALATSALPLADVNARRTPHELSGSGMSDAAFVQPAATEYGSDFDDGAIHYDIPMPLHAQMSAMPVPVRARRRSEGPIGSMSSAFAGSAAHHSTPSSQAVSKPRIFARDSVTSPLSSAPSGTAEAVSGSTPKSMPAIRRPRVGSATSEPSQVFVARPEMDSSASQASGSSATSPRTHTSQPTAQTTTHRPVAEPNRADAAGTSSSTVKRPPSSVTSPWTHTGDRTVAAASYSGAASAFDEATSGLGQAPARTRLVAAKPLRFMFPASARWWTGASAGKPGYTGQLASSGAVVAGPQTASPDFQSRKVPDARVVARGSAEQAGAPAVTHTAQQSGAVSTRGTAPMQRASRISARGAAASPDVFVQGPSASSRGLASESYGGGLADSETAYVVLGSDGNAQVMGAASAGQVAQQKGRGASVDMAVVAAVPPQAPSLEQMSVPGHDRPHAKSKKEGSMAQGTPKSDAMSLHGTVDSLAQRIYHRLRRRLEADRERFGG